MVSVSGFDPGYSGSNPDDPVIHDAVAQSVKAADCNSAFGGSNPPGIFYIAPSSNRRGRSPFKAEMPDPCPVGVVIYVIS